MLFSPVRLAAAVLFVGSLLLVDSAAEAQRVRYGFGGVRVRAPGVGVRVGPFGGVRVRAPGVAIGAPAVAPPPAFYRPRFPIPAPGPAVRVQVPGFSYSAGPTPASAPVATTTAPRFQPTPQPQQQVPSQPTPVAAARPTLAADYGLVSDADLAAMSSETMLAALRDASAALHARLDEFANGEGWQAYFALDDAANGDLAASEKLLRRFDAVARDAQFGVVTQLEEFTGMRRVLRALVDRGGVAAPVAAGSAAAVPPAAPAEELLPLPTFQDEPTPTADAERSILKP